MFYVVSREAIADSQAAAASAALFNLGRAVVGAQSTSIGVIVSSDHGAEEMASVSAGVLLETLSGEFGASAAPMSLFSWLRRQPDGVEIRERGSRTRWRKVPLEPRDARGAVRLQAIGGKRVRALVFSDAGDFSKHPWELDAIALGVQAQEPWRALAQLPAKVLSNLSVDSAASSTIAIYLVASDQVRAALSSTFVKLWDFPEVNIDLNDWLGVQTSSLPSAFYRTAIVPDMVTLGACLSKDRLPHTASNVTIIASGGVLGSVRRRIIRSGYSGALRRVTIVSLLPVKRISPERLHGMCAEWKSAAAESDCGLEATVEGFNRLALAVGRLPRGMALVPA